MPVGVRVAEISLMSQMPPIYVMNREYEPIYILPLLIFKYNRKTYALGFHKRVGDEATTATFHFVKCHEIVQRRRRLL